MRFLVTATVALVACNSDPTVTPDPSETSSPGTGAGGASSAADASSSATDASSSTGDGGAPTSSASTGSGGEGAASTQGGGYEDGSRIKARYLVGADGAAQPLGWFDSDRRENCQAQTAVDGSLRCLPFGVPATMGYADASCAGARKAMVSSAACEDAAYALEASPASCIDGDFSVNSTRLRVFALGADVTGTAFFVLNPTTQACTGLLVPNGHNLRAADEVAPQSFVHFEEQVGGP